MNSFEQNLFNVAALLKSEDGENPEYDRALVEMISCLTGYDFDDVAARLEKWQEVEVPDGLA